MKKRFISRKGQPQQNVLCAIRFDGIFTYVLAGAEGSMNDAALMRQARSRSFNPPAGRYYLGDAGFACERGILTPFLGERYHQAETRAYLDATSAKEAYNILHAGRRVRIENLFGDIKKRWLLLENCPAEYSYKDQVRMVYAVTAVHNFVALKRQDDVPLNPTQDWSLEMARRQANDVVGMRAGKAVRHDVAIWAWEALEARRARRRDNNIGRRSDDDDDDAIEVVV
ncbi:retrotransposon protein [Colletotrichum camelliae]|nr:retrotransposon protein [Colletotrichum camelliae]